MLEVDGDEADPLERGELAEVGVGERAAALAEGASQFPAFHQAALEVGIESYGADSNDPGHVYLPDTDAATGMELAVLRLIPRVPRVTLATGRPVDETPIPGMDRYWRELEAEFITRLRPYPIRSWSPPTAALRRCGRRRSCPARGWYLWQWPLVRRAAYESDSLS